MILNEVSALLCSSPSLSLSASNSLPYKMAETISSSTTKRVAVVTGSNKGIGLEICKQLAQNGVFVVLTARNEKRGVEAVENLQKSGLSDVVFHQLDVMDPSSIASLAEFIHTQFGKLDILVNNAGITGTIINGDLITGQSSKDALSRVIEAMKQTNELAEECLKTNYYGTKGVTEALLPCLKLSKSPRIVNVSSTLGKLEYVTNERAKMILNDIDGLTEEKVEGVLNEFLKDCKDGLLESKGWSSTLPVAYIVSKAAMNAYTRILAKKFPTFIINSVCPGIVKTDINLNTGPLTVEEGAETPVWLALLPDGGSSGLFFSQKEVRSF